MLKDSATLNAKGHVKLELYNEQGVFFTKEKKNLVVQSANEIVANMMADPAKVLRISQVDKGDSSLSANADLLYAFPLSVQGEQKAKFENDWGIANVTTEFTLESLQGITSLDKVTVGVTALVIDQDVFLLDAEKGTVKFAVAPTEKVVFEFHKAKNKYMKVIAGTEKVEVNGTAWERAAVAKHAELKYAFNARTGEVLFEQPVQLVKVSYDYNMSYALGFMSLGGKPSISHPNYQPVEFGNSDKLKTFMANEFAGARMPVHYPAAISNGATELEPAIPTQPVATVQKTATIAITDIGDGVTKKLTYDLANLHDSGSGATGRTLFELVSVTNTTTGANIKANTTNPTNTLASVTIKFADADVETGHAVNVVYRLKLDNRHLSYTLGQAPVVKLVAVRWIDANDVTNVRPYKIIDDGLRANQGDVWISNPNTGTITFTSAVPVGADSLRPAPRPETPGQIQVEYMVNSGTVVKFIADFPKGVPAPVLEPATKTVVAVSGQSSITLDYPIAKDDKGAFLVPTVKVGSTTLTPADFTISLDGRTITPNSLSANQTVTVDYKYEKTTHDIYQVAMFDDKVGGKMFNISGIGPVTKDKNTGMRVTWSVTF
jgi:hypothetical protein